MGSAVKNFLLVILIGIGANMLISGPERLYKRFKSMYEKPEATVYPLKCVFGVCLPQTFSCIVDSNCRKTVGKSRIKSKV